MRLRNARFLERGPRGDRGLAPVRMLERLALTLRRAGEGRVRLGLRLVDGGARGLRACGGLLRVRPRGRRPRFGDSASAWRGGSQFIPVSAPGRGISGFPSDASWVLYSRAVSWPRRAQILFQNLQRHVFLTCCSGFQVAGTTRCEEQF